MRIIQLHKISSELRRSDYSDSDDPTEVQAPPAQAAPVAINADAIRCFYQRRADRGPGTRITFKDGGGFAVTETYDEVLQQVITH